MSCPICASDTNAKYRPFCSKRCADVDLARWFNGGYSVPSENPEDAEKAIEEVEAQLATGQRKPH